MIPLSLAVVFCLSSSAHANTEPDVTQPGGALAPPSVTVAPIAPAPAVGKPVVKRYRNAVLLTDVAAWSLLFLGAETSEPLLAVGTAGIVLGGPVIHLLHRQPGKSALSLLLRVGLPMVGAGIGAMGPVKYDLAGAIILGAAGLVTANLIDAFVLAKYTESSSGNLQYSRASSRSWAPTVMLTGEVKTVGLAGRW